MMVSISAGARPKRLQQRWHPEHVYHALEIVAQHPQGQFGFRFLKSAHEDAGNAHQPFIVPKGCSANWRLCCIHMRLLMARRCIASRASSWKLR